jgi:hypothetical protein
VGDVTEEEAGEKKIIWEEKGKNNIRGQGEMTENEIIAVVVVVVVVVVVADKEGNKEIKKRICYKEGRGDKGEKRT